MKSLVSIVFLMFLLSSNAQQPPPPYPIGSYVAGPDLDKFVGTWKYINGGDIFTIVLEKQVIITPAPNNWQIENIVGWHEFIKNGTLKESSLAFVGTSYQLEKWTIFGQNKTKNNGLTLSGSFFDITKNKTCNIQLTISGTNNTQLDMIISEQPGLKAGGFRRGFSVVNNITLIKQ